MKKLLIIFTILFSITTASQSYTLTIPTNDEIINFKMNLLLEKENIDCEQELYILRETYQNDLLLEQSLDEKEKIRELIKGLDIIISEYTVSKSAIHPFANGQTNLAIAMVIAYFSNNNYALANELLIHSTINTDRNSTYTPTNKNVVRNTKVFENLAKGTSTKGTATFIKGNTSESDCYFALHKVSYTKSTGTSRTVKITDYYDYASSNYSGLEGIAVDAMYTSQQNGYIVPYHISFSATL